MRNFSALLAISSWVVTVYCIVQKPLLQASSGPATQRELAWDLSRSHDSNSTGRWIFDTVNSFLKLWPNTRYRNGHNVVAGIIPRGTLLYHGTSVNRVPDRPEWTAVDPEHSYFFCRDESRDLTGCWHITLVAKRPLRVLYFDGSSAAKMLGGSMDTQDLLVWGGVQPNRTFDERARIADLCAWADVRDIDGFLRMEMDFEVMLCDFNKTLSTLSISYLHKDNPRPGPGHGPMRSTELTYRMLEAGKWHDQFPAEQRIKLDYTRIVSLYDTSLFPDLHHKRQNQERWDHRGEGIGQIELDTFLAELNKIAQGEWGVSASGIDWPALLITIEQRYNERLEILRYILTELSERPDRKAEDIAVQAHNHVKHMLIPYLLQSTYSAPENGSTNPTPDSFPQWAAPVLEECATTYTRYLQTPAIISSLTRSERMLLRATEETLKEICRSLVGIWADGMDAKFPDQEQPHQLIEVWRRRVQGLIDWLDWSHWVTCTPVCGYEVRLFCTPKRDMILRRCTGDMLPADMAYVQESTTPPHPYRRPASASGVEDFPPPGPDDDWYHPTPRCIRRLEPFGL